MRLLFVIDCLGSGGAQRQMVNLALGLTQRSHTVEFFLYYPQIDHFAPLLNDAGILVHSYQKKNRHSLFIVVALRKIIQHGNYDLVLSFLPTPNFYAILSRFFLFRGPRLIVSDRSGDLNKKIAWTEKIARVMYRVADHIIVNSHHQRENLESKYPSIRRKLSTIYNGYDLTLFSPDDCADVPSNPDLRLLVLASILPRKNGLCLVRALNILRNSYGLSPKVSWAGEKVMSGEPLSYLQQMDREIAQCGLSAQWHWLGQRTDIVDLLRHHDVLIHPAFIEGLPNVVCEALACGRPVIVSDALDHNRLVQDGVTGFLFDWRDPADLAKKIHRFATLAENSRTEMGRCARKFAEQNLSLERYVQEFEQLMSGLL